MIKINLVTIAACCFLASSLTWGNNTTSVNYDGTLVNLACVIDDETPIEVNMGSIIDKQIYLHGHSVNKKFNLILKDCDPMLANSIVITLNGSSGNVTPDGYLKFDTGSEAKGAVIGIADDKLSRVQIGKKLSPRLTESGTMSVPLYAFVQGTPEAIQNNSITLGQFTATLFYTINFE
ncbi:MULTISPECIES: fimbrial protein [Providencia]|uniref:Fimbrial-type adhesion domain-containing protein n=1 Tax=Providencia rettgeri TaxID=587 RepID=A0A219X571_PRORE|nr:MULTISPECIES: fimbrial protein [Providencia]APC14115.1 Fimbria A protein precursor,fimbrial protein SteF,P pilus assembly protein, pilin FimA,Fimbrial protein [Providencia rettgeri]MBG5929721.1 fimbrial protein [Providencia rettgeri]MBN6367405.1 fimbrial protein [Providencia rettgeri]OZS73038.1 hypothetical protein CHI95_18765 [Providencia rettgeri]HEC8326446.1 fimbrial protein [Providencia rettgeri]